MLFRCTHLLAFAVAAACVAADTPSVVQSCTVSYGSDGTNTYTTVSAPLPAGITGAKVCGELSPTIREGLEQNSMKMVNNVCSDDGTTVTTYISGRTPPYQAYWLQAGFENTGWQWNDPNPCGISQASPS